MRLLWTLLKVVIALALVLPISIIVLATVLGLFASLLGLAVLGLRLAVIGLLGWGAYRFIRWVARGSTPHPPQREVTPLPKVDPHYEAAMRELDRELGHVSR